MSLPLEAAAVMQNLANTRSYQFAPGDTAAHAFPGGAARLVQFQADSSNSGRVTVLGVGADGALDSAGPSLAAGEWAPPMWVTDLSQVGYQLSNSADRVNLLVGR